jgi:hypothetical protein
MASFGILYGYCQYVHHERQSPVLRCCPDAHTVDLKHLEVSLCSFCVDVIALPGSSQAVHTY